MKRHFGIIIIIVLIYSALLTDCREEFQYEYDEANNTIIDPEPIDGISAGYVNLYDPQYGVTVNQYSAEGKVVLSYSGQLPDIRKGSIITVDLDTMGYLRRVLEVTNKDNKITLQTEQAYLNDVFVDKDFTLNTDLIPPGEIINSKSSLEEISKAFTDEKGQLHPVEIICYDDEGKIQRRSASELISKSKDEDYNIIEFYEDFSNKDLYGKAGDNIHFYIDEGHASLTSDAILDFDFDWDGELDEDTKVKKGDLRFFSFYLDSRAGFLTKLALDMSRDFNKDGDKKLLDIKKITVKFIVLSVPVWISVDCDIWGAYEFNSTASLYADWGFESIHTLKVGGTYNGQTKSFDPIKEYVPQNNIYPLNISGELDVFARLELYPRVEVLFYSVFGPFVEIVPYVEGNYNSAIKSQITPGGSKTFLAWNGNLDIGLDLRIGAKLTFLGLFGEEFGPTTLNCFNSTLWDSPKSLELLTTLPQEVAANSTIPLSIIVKDNLDNPVPFCSVYLFGDGSFSNELPISDLEGTVSTNWIMDGNPGEKQLIAEIFNTEGIVIDGLTSNITIPEHGTNDFVTVIIQPGPEGEDAYVQHDRYADGSEYFDNKDGNDTLIYAYLDGHQDGSLWERESLIKFPLSQIPSHSTIISAKFNVFGYASINYKNQNATITLSKLLSPWDEQTVNWLTKPESEIISSIDFPRYGGPTWHEWDVTTIVQSWINGESNFGFGISAANNTIYCDLSSGDNSNSTQRPKLIITYNID
ncbi:MAG: DNRLRE domain-containing protein [Bacteroidales bacterium]|nr:DNRLRE domain-containing protein [Bacteroidales bacterium]